mmetsp:Transcript_1382/g.3785  ORF Transcript_1382/g.3785 Transcript_1382/m.3785 type:complete len:337 (+) Transcript_1382:2-1012(+)
MNTTEVLKRLRAVRHVRWQSSSAVSEVKIVEVGPRDGLQNESTVVSVDDKVQLITRLAQAGCQHIETGSFVSPKWVPTMANTTEVMQRLSKWKEEHPSKSVSFSCLVPNLKGLEQALLVKPAVNEIAVFGAASEEFSQRNINCSIDESMERFRKVTNAVKQAHPEIKIRGYLSCVIACPYQGPIDPKQVASVAERMMDELSCHELSLGDTIGVGTPAQTVKMLDAVRSALGTTDNLAVHFHDTYGQALANILVALDKFGIEIIDSSVAGLGGCPYAKGASGNVATEDVCYMLQGMGIKTGIDIEQLVETGGFITNVLQKSSNSKVALAMACKEDVS